MEYELAKELKDAGFPQMQTIVDFDANKTEIGGTGSSKIVGKELVYIPTLEELIEACGDRFAMIGRDGNYWYARADEPCNECWFCEPNGDGLNPAEAVARLWLALNKK